VGARQVAAVVVASLDSQAGLANLAVAALVVASPQLIAHNILIAKQPTRV
jgi:methionine-rich copper-binding protein CopC